MDKERLRSINLFVATIWITIFVSIWQYQAAPIYDDVQYSRITLDEPSRTFWDGKGDFISSWQDVGTSIVNQYARVSGRLANTLMIVTEGMPHGIASIIVGVLAGLMFWLLIMTLERISKQKVSAWVIWLLAIVLWKWLPWDDNMVSRAYSLNYLCPTVTSLWYALVFFNEKEDRSRLYVAGGLLAGFLTGWLHEGFALPLLGASVLLLCLSKEDRRLRGWLIIALLIGTLLCVLAPATLNRVNHRMDDVDAISYGFLIKQIAKTSWFSLIIAVAILAACWLKMRKNLAKLLNKQILFWGIVALASFAIGIVLKGSGRVMWPAQVGFMICVFAVLNGCYRPIGAVNICLSAVLGLLCIVWSAGVLSYEHRLTSTQYELISALKQRGDGIAYVDLVREQDVPWWTCGLYHQYFPDPYLWQVAFDYAPTRLPLVLPKAYEGKPFEQWKKMPGDNPFRGTDNFWYSREKIEKGTRYIATLGDKTAKKWPGIPVSTTSEVTAGEPYIVLTEQQDTLWMIPIVLPTSRELVSFDRL